MKTSISIIILMLALVLSTWTHWWWRVFSFQIAINGKNSSGSAAYFHGKDLVVCVDEPQNTKYRFCYLIHSDKNEVGLSDATSIFNLQPLSFLLLPGAAYSKDVPPSETLMGSAKVETLPRLIRKPNGVAFTSFYKSRIDVTW